MGRLGFNMRGFNDGKEEVGVKCNLHNGCLIGQWTMDLSID